MLFAPEKDDNIYLSRDINHTKIALFWKAIFYRHTKIGVRLHGES